jgi:hypothetical protein
MEIFQFKIDLISGGITTRRKSARFLWNNPDAGRHCGSRTHLADEIRRCKRSRIPPFKVIPLCNAHLWHLSVGINFQIFRSILFILKRNSFENLIEMQQEGADRA